MRYDTPPDIAKALARYIPRRTAKILEPSVGLGILLSAAIERISRHVDEVVCIDIDKEVLDKTSSKFVPILGNKLTSVNYDFLDWATMQKGEIYDCILMNPPFEARKFIKLKNDFTNNKEKYVSSEVAFLIKSLELLKVGGRLLAVLPASVICSQSTSWFRKKLTEFGKINHIHELPRKAFPGLESRVYLLVFDKGRKQQKLTLLNHDLLRPHSLKVSWAQLGTHFRFDYKYYEAQNWISMIKSVRHIPQWSHLNKYAEVRRGSEISPKGPNIAMHTTDYINGFWYLPIHKQIKQDNSNYFKVTSKDILVKRVGRNAISTISLNSEKIPFLCSDCILVIRPRKISNTLKLLFAIRVIYACEQGSMLFERGTGASFIRASEILDMFIPFNLDQSFPKAFLQYKKALRKFDFSSMKRIEEEVRIELTKLAVS